jgi:5'-nucleotidase / UDP-sugar diphosphatase
VSRGVHRCGRFAQIAGFRFVWNPTGTPQTLDAEGNVVTPGTRVREVVLDDGTALVQAGVVVLNAPALNSATIDFLVRGGDQYSFLGVPFVTLGVPYQQALRSYIAQALSGLITAAQYPERGEGCIVTVE